MKLGVKFNLPFRFVDEDVYEFCYNEVSVKINVKLVQNFEAAEKLMGMKIETSGEGAKVDLDADYHGIVNFTQIKMELQDKTDRNIDWFNSNFKFDIDKAIKITCMQVINRLAEVVRNTTNNYWIRFVSLRDILDFQIFDLSHEPPIGIISWNPNDGYTFPNFNVIEQEKVKDLIKKTLAEQSEIPTWRNLFLDSINYFTTERYNEAVIMVNVSLESFIADYLYDKLNQKNPDKQKENREEILRLPKSMHRIMKKHFPNIDGRNLTDNQKLWEKFDNIRINIRPSAMHSFTRKIDQRTAFNTIQDIKEIIKWVEQPAS